jgi:hypothetical protein
VLEFSGVLRESDGTFTIERPVEAPVGFEGSGPTRQELAAKLQPSPARVPTGVPQVVLNVHVWIGAKEADLEGLADELKQLMAKLSET